MKNEGFRPVNGLGIIFGIMWLIGNLCTLGANYFPIVDSNNILILWQIPGFSLYREIIIYVICYFECMFISTVMSAFLATKYEPTFDRDYIIILGCRIRKDGSLTPLLKGRVDRAIDFEKKQFEKTGKHAVFVPSGGQGSDEVLAEGKAMENYLLDRKIPKQQIVCENKSVNTYENMKLSKKIIEQHDVNLKNKKIAFATTNYHVFRGYILAGRNGFDAKGLSAKTKMYFYPNAFLREFIGLLVDRRIRHIIFIISTIVFLLLLEYAI